MSWLSDECLAELKTKGYMAVPKDMIRVFYAERIENQYMLTMMHDGQRESFANASKRDLAMQMALTLLKEGFIEPVVQPKDRDDVSMYIWQRCELTVIKPR